MMKHAGYQIHHILEHMKVTFITLFSFVVFLVGCVPYQQTIREDIEIVSAEFKHWSEAPIVQSDVRERGTDLSLAVKNWPSDAKPDYIIFRKRRSFPAEITDSTDVGVRIEARIILRSSVMAEVSERVEASDRLVFTTSDGKRQYIEIPEWSVMEQ